MYSSVLFEKLNSTNCVNKYCILYLLYENCLIQDRAQNNSFSCTV